MEDIVAVAVKLEDSTERFFLTWGRIQDAVDPAPLAQLVLSQSHRFVLGGTPVSARICTSLQEVAHMRFFYEGFFNGRALVIFGRYDGDPGLSSRSRDTADGHTQQVEFYLSNGQRDEYPQAWTVPTSDALAAFDYTFIHRQAAPWIDWHDDA